MRRPYSAPIVLFSFIVTTIYSVEGSPSPFEETVTPGDKFRYCGTLNSLSPEISPFDCLDRVDRLGDNLCLKKRQSKYLDESTCLPLRRMRLWQNAYAREVARLLGVTPPQSINIAVSKMFAKTLEPCQLGGNRPAAYGNVSGNLRKSIMRRKMIASFEDSEDSTTPSSPRLRLPPMPPQPATTTTTTTSTASTSTASDIPASARLISPQPSVEVVVVTPSPVVAATAATTVLQSPPMPPVSIPSVVEPKCISEDIILELRISLHTATVGVWTGILLLVKIYLITRTTAGGATTTTTNAVGAVDLITSIASAAATEATRVATSQIATTAAATVENMAGTAANSLSLSFARLNADAAAAANNVV